MAISLIAGTLKFLMAHIYVIYQDKDYVVDVSTMSIEVVARCSPLVTCDTTHGR